jgi:hypothetical protein
MCALFTLRIHERPETIEVGTNEPLAQPSAKTALEKLFAGQRRVIFQSYGMEDLQKELWNI